MHASTTLSDLPTVSQRERRAHGYCAICMQRWWQSRPAYSRSSSVCGETYSRGERLRAVSLRGVHRPGRHWRAMCSAEQPSRAWGASGEISASWAYCPDPAARYVCLSWTVLTCISWPLCKNRPVGMYPEQKCISFLEEMPTWSFRIQLDSLKVQKREAKKRKQKLNRRVDVTVLGSQYHFAAPSHFNYHELQLLMMYNKFTRTFWCFTKTCLASGNGFTKS